MEDDGKTVNAQGPREGPRAIPTLRSEIPSESLPEKELHRAWEQLERAKRGRLESIEKLSEIQWQLGDWNRYLIQCAGTLRDQGVSVREIAERLELSPQFLYQLAKRPKVEDGGETPGMEA